MKNVACVGIIVADIIVEPVDDYPEKGLLKQVNSITLHNGGNAMTAAINLTRLGVDAKMIGKVGRDLFGEYLRTCLNSAGVNTDGLKADEKVQTSSSVLMLDRQTGERSFFHCVGANAVFSIEDIDWNIIEKSDIVFVTGSFLMNTFDGIQTAQFLRQCKQMGKTTFLDVCWDATGKWGEMLNAAMPYIDVFMPSMNEAVRIAEETNIERAADTFLDRGVKTVVIKMGKDGCFLKKNKSEKPIIFPAYKGIKAVDTTGAGDSFCAGFLAAYARGENEEFCAQFANAVGAHCVMCKGATDGIKSYKQILEFMKERENIKNAGNT